MQHIGLIAPNIASYNIGDQIVYKYCRRHLLRMFPNAFLIDIPAFVKPDERIAEIVDKCDYIFFCGTGPLRNELSFHWPIKGKVFKNKVVLMGCGWNLLEDGPITTRTKDILLDNLSNDYYHSVRDDFTMRKLHSIGLRAANTACPTMWDLQLKYEFQTHDDCLFTVNAARANYLNDRKWANAIERAYDNVYFFPQSPYDRDYLLGLPFKRIPKVLNADIDTLTVMFAAGGFDYVGARLHCGIHALNHGINTVIIGVDHRASMIAESTGLPVADYNTPHYDNAGTLTLTLPQENINGWREQFQV